MVYIQYGCSRARYKRLPTRILVIFPLETIIKIGRYCVALGRIFRSVAKSDALKIAPLKVELRQVFPKSIRVIVGFTLLP